jgi:glycosyltransferase involved in cell wall biosynthesis
VAVEVERGILAAERGDPGVYFFDTLNLDRVLTLEGPTPKQRFVLIVHHLPSLEPGQNPDDGSLGIERAALPRFDAFLSTSPFTTDLLGVRGIAAERIFTVPPGLPPITRRSRTYEPPLRAALVGNLVPRKAALEFLATLDALVGERDHFRLDLIGRGDIDAGYAARCSTFVSEAPRLAGRVRIVGPLPYSRMGEVYESCALVVSASKMETFGMSLHEARGYGLPVLARDAGHVRAHFNPGEDGRLFDSVHTLAAGFLSLARDADEMRRLFERAQSRPLEADVTWETAARRLLEQLAARFAGVLDWRGEGDDEAQ